MDETELFNELWGDDTPRENCVFPTRGMLQLSDMYNPRWPGACCDATAMLLTIKANFFAKEYNRPITNVVLLKKDDTTPPTENPILIKNLIINNK